MDTEEIKRGLRAEIKKRENEQYATFQCNVRQMCKDVLTKLEEQESLINEMKAAAADIGLKWHDYDAGEDAWEDQHTGKWVKIPTEKPYANQ
jgi:indole-3-glycerol phosphate synthase